MRHNTESQELQGVQNVWNFREKTGKWGRHVYTSGWQSDPTFLGNHCQWRGRKAGVGVQWYSTGHTHRQPRVLSPSLGAGSKGWGKTLVQPLSSWYLEDFPENVSSYPGNFCSQTNLPLPLFKSSLIREPVGNLSASYTWLVRSWAHCSNRTNQVLGMFLSIHAE